MKEVVPSHKIGEKHVFLKKDLVRWIKEHCKVQKESGDILLYSVTFLHYYPKSMDGKAVCK